MNITNEYQVVIAPFAERHFIKTFAKKYKGAWDTTFSYLLTEFKFIEVLFLRNTAEMIVDSSDIKICKTEFKIAGTKESRHGSGNRCIVAIHKNINKVCVLLVYHKNDLGGGSETGNWQKMIKENYRIYSGLL